MLRVAIVAGLALCAFLGSVLPVPAQTLGVIPFCTSSDEAPPSGRPPFAQMLYPDPRAPIPAAFPFAAFRVGGPRGLSGQLYLRSDSSSSDPIPISSSLDQQAESFSYFHAALPRLQPYAPYSLVFVETDGVAPCTWYAPLPVASFRTGR